jgi:hypothetical protein
VQDLLVVTDSNGRSLAVRQPEEGHFVAGEFRGPELADLGGDLTPFLVGDDIVFAGVALGPDADRVELSTPGIAGIAQTCRVKNGVWMSFPEPFVDGMVLTARWLRGDRLLDEVVSEPLRAGSLTPLRRPGWTGYSPL